MCIRDRIKSFLPSFIKDTSDLLANPERLSKERLDVKCQDESAIRGKKPKSEAWIKMDPRLKRILKRREQRKYVELDMLIPNDDEEDEEENNDVVDEGDEGNANEIKVKDDAEHETKEKPVKKRILIQELQTFLLYSTLQSIVVAQHCFLLALPHCSINCHRCVFIFMSIQ
eukprot:TRINITY_DN1849_c0_g2_i6.p1 TRINITY_DN1849_c0_g2~~TRINITY_DN1849_c0_g2_i6.p1  ORF type:complete len:184 (-),score=18.03 TRINITY_DN1849_c0_g2_i6:108-620(-)